MTVRLERTLRRSPSPSQREPRLGRDSRRAQLSNRRNNDRVNSTRIVRLIKAPRAKVYAALIDADATANWKVPSGMTSHVHAFEAREGGMFRISLTYDAQTGTGKTDAHTDTYHDPSYSSFLTSAWSRSTSSK